ncbi:peroxiredoxin (PRX)-like 2 family protein [Haloferula helveola]|uniref:thioredoxin-dependent peroxiredoxin n=1 Tax=Haloferula helveola TaxID=490095 RepID=A0ABM7RIK2_9BACT|nr:peroxiredoxin (PRX)-like 2 family protein [Haloferula helveola]
MRPQVGDPAPEFEASVVSADGGTGTVRLADLRGKRVVLVFYPKDATPGCTTQACGMRDGWQTLEDKAEIFGVSVDDENSHRKFIEKQLLPYPLIADTDHAIVEAYGVWVEKSMYGRTFMGTERTTFVIGADGRIEAVLAKVKPKEHLAKLAEILAD